MRLRCDANEIRTRDTTVKGWCLNHLTMAPKKAKTGFEPVIRVLQTHALPLGYFALKKIAYLCNHASRWTRTNDTAVNSRVLYRLSYEGKTKYLLYIISSINMIINIKPFQPFWTSPRPISNYHLNALQHLQLSPINLVVFKGSYS